MSYFSAISVRYLQKILTIKVITLYLHSSFFFFVNIFRHFSHQVNFCSCFWLLIQISSNTYIEMQNSQFELKNCNSICFLLCFNFSFLLLTILSRTLINSYNNTTTTTKRRQTCSIKSKSNNKSCFLCLLTISQHNKTCALFFL